MIYETFKSSERGSTCTCSLSVKFIQYHEGAQASGSLILSELFLPVGKPIRSGTGWKSKKHLTHGLNWREF